MSQDDAKNMMTTIKEYFSTPDKPVTNVELIELKKKDPARFAQIKQGFLNGSMTY